MPETTENFLNHFNEIETACTCGHAASEHELRDWTSYDGTVHQIPMCTKCECDELTEKSRPYWECQECHYTNKTKPMPKLAPSIWYARRQPHKCPKCKSEAFQPVGW